LTGLGLNTMITVIHFVFEFDCFASFLKLTNFSG